MRLNSNIETSEHWRYQKHYKPLYEEYISQSDAELNWTLHCKYILLIFFHYIEQWGDYNINNDGILDLCMANRLSKF